MLDHSCSEGRWALFLDTSTPFHDEFSDYLVNASIVEGSIEQAKHDHKIALMVNTALAIVRTKADVWAITFEKFPYPENLADSCAHS